ncbi:MAG: malectin domain-containing carbohydrate-binding protein [Acidobacteriota bacterium]
MARSHITVNTLDPGLYGSERYGHFTYTFPVAEGLYRLVLHFSETWLGPSNPGKGGLGSRIFDVQCNGQTLLKDFDIFREAGGENRALVKEFRRLKPNPQGKLIVTFQPTVNYACVNAIELHAE